MRFIGRKVLVTGAAGFVGCRLVEKLCLEEGAMVNGLVRTWHKATWVSRTHAQLLGGDVTDLPALRTAAQGCDIIFHCASGGGDRDSYFRTNVGGTRNVMEIARESGARVVFVSSSAVHGPVLPKVLRSDSPYVSTGKAYGESKIAAERLIRESFADVASVIIRPTFVWGPRSHLFTTGPLLAMNEGAFRLVNNGNGRCHAVFVDHLVEAMMIGALRDKATGQAFLVTDDVPGMTWRKFYEPLANLLEVPPPLRSVSSSSFVNRGLAWWRVRGEEWMGRLAGNPAPLPRRLARRALFESVKAIRTLGIPSGWDLQKYSQRVEFDLTVTRQILGFQPRLSFEQAFAMTADWIRLQYSDTLRLNPRIQMSDSSGNRLSERREDVRHQQTAEIN